MKERYIESLCELLSLISSSNTEYIPLSKIREEIHNMRTLFPEKMIIINDFYQAVMSGDYSSIKLLKILVESELNKIKKRETVNTKERITDTKEEILLRPIQYVKGVGPTLYERFKKKGINTIKDALFFFPRNYEDRRNIIMIKNIIPGENVTITGKVVYSERRRRTFNMTIADQSGYLDLVWFNIQNYYIEYLNTKFKPDTQVIVSGRATIFRNNIQINHPVIKETASVDDDLLFKRIIPVYSSIDGITEGYLIKIMKNIVDEYSKYISDPLPEYIIKKHNLIPLAEAIWNIHFPPNDVIFDELNTNRWKPKRRLIFDELFSIEMLLAIRKDQYKRQIGYEHHIDESTIQEALKRLPFELTRSQNQALAEIQRDLKKPEQMNRILIGDVGSGKTAIAMITSYLVAVGGTQTAILVPTEILARQHYKNFCSTFPDLKNRIGLFTGSIKGVERSRIIGDISLGHLKIIIGTHTLIEENIHFKDLTYVIIDEQHQFGINQRAQIKAKGLNIDLLMMSATPIPRTLAISLYGDLDISMIKELPPGRKEITTKVIRGEKAERLYVDIKDQIIKNDAQCYIVYPLISESDKLDLKAAENMYEHLKNTYFKDIPIGLIHGKMNDEEKIRAMNEFKENNIKILIATTVIEVGVDIPNASIMVIEHAERFGLSQLHQLRGRVGRGSKESICYLVAYNWLSENAYERLKIMEKTNNGFKIAEEDLRIRGPGELAGTRQSGIPDLHMSNLIRDADILEEARNSAFEIIKDDPDLINIKNIALKDIIKRREKAFEVITTS